MQRLAEVEGVRRAEDPLGEPADRLGRLGGQRCDDGGEPTQQVAGAFGIAGNAADRASGRAAARSASPATGGGHLDRRERLVP